MKGLLIFLAFALASVSGNFGDGLKVKFNLGLTPWAGKDFFYDVARTISAAILDGWELTKRPDGPLESLVLYCPKDRHCCGLYDSETGHIGGLQVAIPINEFTDGILDWTVQGFTKWTVITEEGDVNEYWTIAQYFVSDEYLKKPVQERIDSRVGNKVLQEGWIWLTGFNKKVDRFPVTTNEIENTIFTKQACIPWMGHHYYYNMTQHTECKSDTLYPWFLLCASDALIGIGFVVPGQLPIKEDTRDWFERPPKTAVEVIVPRGPSCLYDMADNPKLLTMHTYFIDQPWTVTCLFQ